jgi:hypothetical protein
MPKMINSTHYCSLEWPTEHKQIFIDQRFESASKTFPLSLYIFDFPVHLRVFYRGHCQRLNQFIVSSKLRLMLGFVKLFFLNQWHTSWNHFVKRRSHNSLLSYDMLYDLSMYLYMTMFSLHFAKFHTVFMIITYCVIHKTRMIKMTPMQPLMIRVQFVRSFISDQNIACIEQENNIYLVIIFPC